MAQPPQTFDQPLSASELAALDQQLRALNGDDQGLEFTDGYCSAMLIGPGPLTNNDWLPALIRNTEALSPEAVTSFIALLFRHWNRLATRLDETPPRVTPILDRDAPPVDLDDPTQPDLPDPGDWCRGFRQAMSQRKQAWQPLLDSAEADLLAPIMMFATEAGREQLINMADDRETAGFWREQVVSVTPAIQRYWQQRQQQAQASARLSQMLAAKPSGMPGASPAGDEKTGRNALCPCGSGRKFKRCCGDPAHTRH